MIAVAAVTAAANAIPVSITAAVNGTVAPVIDGRIIVAGSAVTVVLMTVAGQKVYTASCDGGSDFVTSCAYCRCFDFV